MNGSLLWDKSEMRSDMKHFKELTTDSVIIMGRKTFDSIGAVLPNRQSIVITRSKECKIPGVKIAHSIDQAYHLSKDYDEVYVVGGGEIYRQAIDSIERIYATEVSADIINADTFFPKLNRSWLITDEKVFPADKNNIYPYKFVTYEKR